MNCPRCGGRTLVKDSRPSTGNHVRRRRHCECGNRFTTMETIVVDQNPELRAHRTMLEVALAQVREHAGAIISLVPNTEA